MMQHHFDIIFASKDGPWFSAIPTIPKADLPGRGFRAYKKVAPPDLESDGALIERF